MGAEEKRRKEITLTRVVQGLNRPDASHGVRFLHHPRLRQSIKILLFPKNQL
jgi:hypothetical protein